MPNVRGIMGVINAALLSGNFKSMPFQSSSFNTLAYVIPTKDDAGVTYRPVIQDNAGNCTELDLNDLYNFQVFHVLDDFDFSEKQADDFGSPGNIISENDTCRMIVMGNTATLGLVREDIMSAVMVDFPREFDAGLLTSLGLSSCVFDQVIVSQDQEEIFASLWKGHDYFMLPQTFLYAVSYRLKCEYAKHCFTLCK